MEPIIISASFFQEQLSLGVLGRTGEHEARRISFDCGEVLKTWPEATILCVCRRPCDTAAYPIPLTTDGTTYTMPLTSRETAASGTIKLELRAVRDDTVLKSAIFYGRILPSLNGQKDAPGNPLSDALNRLESTIANAQTLADEIRQKLDNGEFVGGRGPQGEPGKDGSDATVTAQNIQSALGYTPVTPSDLAAKQNVLTDADKQSITKIGMTTGAAWTIAEQKAARIRMGIDKAYELIEEITLTEKVTQLIRNAEPNGTPYHFKKMYVSIKMPQAENNGSVYSMFNNTLVGIAMNCITSKWHEGGIAQIYANVVDGFLDGYGVGAPNVGTSTNLVRYVTPSNIPSGIAAIDSMNIKATVGMPINTNIKIYGVRA